MQRRPWVIVVTLLVFALAFSVLVSIRYLNRSDRLRQQILHELRDVPGDISIGSASIAATTLQLSNINYSNPQQHLSIKIRRVSVRFALGNWITHEGGIERLVESVTVVDPVITLRESSTDEKPGKKKKNEVPDLSRLEFLRRAILRGGTFRYLDRNGTPWIVLHNLDGWEQGESKGRVSIQLAGSLYQSSEQNLLVEASVDLKTLATQSDITLRGYDLSTMDLPAHSPVLNPAGLLTAHARMDWRTDDWDLTGNLRIENGQLHVRHGPKIDKLQLSGLAEDGLLTLSGTLSVEDDPGNIDAAFAYKNGIRLTASADIPSARLGRHLGTFTGLPRHLQPKGTLHTQTTFRWVPAERNWDWTIHGTSTLIETPVGKFHDVETGLHWDREAHALKFDSLMTVWQGLQVGAQAAFQPRQAKSFVVHGNIKGTVDPSELPAWTAPLATKSTQGELSIEFLKGDGWTVKGTGRIRGTDHRAVGEYNAIYRVDGYHLRMDLYSPNKRDAWVTMQQKPGRPVEIAAQDPQTLAHWWDHKIQFPERLDQLHARATIQLLTDGIRGQADILDPVSDVGVHLFGSLKGKLSEALAGTYGFRLSRHDQQVGYGEVDLAYSDGLLDVQRLQFMDYLNFSGRIDLTNRRFGHVVLTLDDLDLSHVVPRVSAVPEGRIQGMIGGQLTVDGSFSRPTIDSHFELYDGRYGDLTQYWGVLTLATNVEGDVYVRQGMLGRAGTTILQIDGGYNMPADEFDLRLAAPKTDAKVLAEAAAGKSHLLEGPIALSGHLTGSLKFPTWTASMSMVDAHVAGIAFDDVDIELRGETSERLGHILYIDHFAMDRVSRYKFTASGAAPLTRGAGQISAKLEGEVLDVLPQLTPFVKGASGSGIFDWTVTVVAGKMAASNGVVQVNNGSVSFADVLPTLSQLAVDLQVGVDGEMTINKFDGIFGDNSPARIRNQPGNPNDSKMLPIEIEGIGLNLGVLELQTPSEEGIPMRFPGVMTTEDFGRIRFSGRNNTPWFTVSGPVDSLLMTGSMRVANSRITFPPIPEGNGSQTSTNAQVQKPSKHKPRGFLALFNNARWNGQIQVAENVHYEREVVGLEGTPFLGALSEIISQINVDLTIDPTEPNRPVEVTGCMADNSLRLLGEFSSTQGRLDLLDLNFELQRADVTFDQTSLLPVVSGRAVTYVVQETSDPNAPRFSRELYLTLYVIDPVTGERTPRGRWGDFTFVLEDQEGSSQEQVLNALGYQAGSLTQRATAIGAGGIERALVRRWLRPIERDIARVLGLDLVRFDPSITSYLLNTSTLDTTGATGTLSQMKSSSVKVGKYLLPNLFVSYTGQLGGDPLARYSVTGAAPAGRIAYLQSWDVEYRVRPISPNLVLQGGWEYDNLAPDEQGKRNNRSIRLKYTLVYDLTKINLTKVWRELWN